MPSIWLDQLMTSQLLLSSFQNTLYHVQTTEKQERGIRSKDLKQEDAIVALQYHRIEA